MRSDPLAVVAGKRYWRARDARIIVEAWRRAGEGLSRFATRYGVDSQRLSRWARKLKRAQPGTLRFHPARLMPAATGSIEIDLGNGRRVRVPRGFEPDDLRRVLAVLAESAAC
jgi:hypothetical protein